MHDRFFLIQNHYDLQNVSINEITVFVKEISLLIGCRMLWKKVEIHLDVTFRLNKDFFT